jgi:dipeptidase E
MARQIIVSGGAGYWGGTDALNIDRFVFSLTGRARPKVCALFTASGDLPAHIESFYDIVGPLCQPSHFSMFRPPANPPEQMLVNQDVIYVGAGNTANLLAVWRTHGIDRILHSALDQGTILFGSSAGGLCWFESGLTDSLGFDATLRSLSNGLGFLSGSHAPHFDTVGRRDSYGAMVRSGELPNGIGIDECAAVHFVDGQIDRVVAVTADATAHLVNRQSDGHTTINSLLAEQLCS